MGRKVYEYESLIYEAAHKGGAYVVFPYDVRAEFGKGRVKVHATFDGEPYDEIGRASCRERVWHSV